MWLFDVSEVDLFGATPFNAVVSPQGAPAAHQNPFAPPPGPGNSGDAFGMTPFQPSSQELEQQIQNVDKELMDLQVNRWLINGSFLHLISMRG